MNCGRSVLLLALLMRLLSEFAMGLLVMLSWLQPTSFRLVSLWDPGKIPRILSVIALVRYGTQNLTQRHDICIFLHQADDPIGWSGSKISRKKNNRQWQEFDGLSF